MLFPLAPRPALSVVAARPSFGSAKPDDDAPKTAAALARRLIPATATLLLETRQTVAPSVLEAIDSGEVAGRAFTLGPGGTLGDVPEELRSGLSTQEDLLALLKKALAKRPDELEKGTGSAFWVNTAQGPRLLTNHHVAVPPRQITVPLGPGVFTKLPAEVLSHRILAQLGVVPTHREAREPQQPVRVPMVVDQKIHERSGNPIDALLQVFNDNLAELGGDIPAEVRKSFEGMLALAGEARQAADHGVDLAVLRPEDPDWRLPKGIAPLVLEPDMDRVEVGERVFSASNAGGQRGHLLSGIVSGFKQKRVCDCGHPKHEGEKPHVWLYTTLPLSGGDSGSPVVRANGRVIGINAQGPDSGSRGHGAAASAIVERLRDWGFLE